MCDIWKIKDFPELDLRQYEKLPTTLRDINISGGEPFLRSDIVKIIEVITKRVPKARIVISSNGFTPALIESQMKKILAIKPDIGVAISVDGYGMMHEEIRGIKHGWEKDMETIERLQKLGMKNLRLAFTIQPKNIKDFSKVYDESRKRGIQFTHAFAQSSEHYFGGIQLDNHPDMDELKKQYSYVMNQELRSWSLKRWIRAYFAYGLFRFSTERQQVLSNDPGRRFFYMDSRGVVFPSVVHNYPMGNIQNNDTFDKLWQSDKAHKARHLVATKGQPAWMICTARTAIKKHPLRVARWIIRNRIGGVSL